MNRCAWVPGDDDLYLAYHDQEWGVPERDPARLFEMLTLEGAQAGLSWRTILAKRDGYRRAFAGFDVATVAAMNETDVARLVQDTSIVRHRGKIESTISNARVIVTMDQGFSDYIWSYVDGQPLVGNRRVGSDLPAQTPLSAQVSRDLKRRGFRFVGPTTVYSFLQAVGVVNDHTTDCFRFEDLPGVR